MRPHERRLIRRMMFFTTFLVLLMVAATVWTTVQNRGAGSAPRTGSSSGSESDSSGQ